MDEVGTVTR